jgi:hypothetical protein
MLLSPAATLRCSGETKFAFVFSHRSVNMAATFTPVNQPFGLCFSLASRLDAQ